MAEKSPYFQTTLRPDHFVTEYAIYLSPSQILANQKPLKENLQQIKRYYASQVG